MEDKARVKFFLAMAFQKNYIAIWSCMKLENVLEVLPMFMFKNFLNQFVFIWGCEQCSKMFGEISLESHYYIKDLKCMHYACHGLPYGKEDQTLLINDEPSRALWNPKWSGFFLHKKGELKNKMQWLDLTSHLWSLLVELPRAKTIQVHYEFMVKYFKLHLSSSSRNYCWFLQYMDNDNGNVCNNHPPLGMHFASFHLIF
jgi:hypothetical protein